MFKILLLIFVLYLGGCFDSKEVVSREEPITPELEIVPAAMEQQEIRHIAQQKDEQIKGVLGRVRDLETQEGTYLKADSKEFERVANVDR